jgi:hypothetical protein
VAKPTNYPKPELGHLSTRQINLSGTRSSVENQLFDWVTDICTKIKQPRGENGSMPQTPLMLGAQESINVLMQAVPLAAAASMRLGPSSPKKLVHANVYWVRKPDGRWMLKQICFALYASTAVIEEATRRAEAQAIREAADRRAAMYFDRRKAVFPVEYYTPDKFPDNLKAGEQLVEYAIELAVENAREDVKALENPVTPVDMALDLTGLGVGTAAKTGAEGVKKLAEVYENIDKAKTVLDSSKVVMEQEKSTGDKALEIGLGLSGSVPVAGPFIKTLAGMFFEGVIASDAGRITKLRSRCYLFFVAGFVKQLTMVDTGRPLRRIDQKYFDLGMRQAAKNESGRVRTTIALIHYAGTNYTAGGWGGLSFHGREFEYPDEYIVQWSPTLLAKSLATQLNRGKYLYKNAD